MFTAHDRSSFTSLTCIDNGKLVGFISIGDLVKAAMEDQKVLIEQLKQYISG